MESSHLERIEVVLDGRIKATFHDNSLLLLGADATSFISVSADGNSARHLTRYALHRHSAKLREILRFRNLHFTNSFYESWVLADEKRNRRVYCETQWSAQWPQTLTEGVEKELIEIKHDKVFVFSKDCKARLVYDILGCRVSVRSPLQISANSTEHLLEDKVFYVARCPPVWQEPLQLALAAVHENQSLKFSSDWIVWKPLGVRSSSLANPFPQDSWWFRKTTVLPKEERVVMEWTPEVLFEYEDQEDEVRGWISIDESYFFSKQNGKYFQHSSRIPRSDSLYAASTVPLSISTPEGEILYSLSRITDRAQSLKRHNLDCKEKKIAAHSCPPLLSSEVFEEREMSDGLYTAYVDGRVRVRFSDRTILNLNSSQTQSEVILSCGRTLIVPHGEIPCEIEHYIQLAMDFAVWAFSSCEERQQLEFQQDAVKDAMAKARLLSVMSKWTATQVPCALSQHSSDSLFGF